MDGRKGCIDNNTNNCNRLFWLKKGTSEVIRLWEFGKQLGVTLNGEEENVLKSLDELEKRDRKLIIERDAGEKIVINEDNKYKYKRIRECD